MQDSPCGPTHGPARKSTGHIEYFSLLVCLGPHPITQINDGLARMIHINLTL